ncbi:sulfite exporter TauE/SafE family protein [archaeon]
MELLGLALVAVTAFFGAFYGVMVGGGSLVTLPVLMFFLPPHVAIATNRFGVMFSSSSATVKYHKEGVFEWRAALPIAAAAMAGAFIGSNFLLALDEVILKKAVSILLILVAIFLFLKKDFGSNPAQRSKPMAYFLAFCVGVYAAMFGPPAGTFYLLILVMFFGFDLVHAAGTKSFLTVASAVVAVAVFAYNGLIDYAFGITFSVFGVLGGWLGARTAVAKGNQFLRLVFTAVTVVLAVSLLLQ